MKVACSKNMEVEKGKGSLNAEEKNMSCEDIITSA